MSLETHCATLVELHARMQDLDKAREDLNEARNRLAHELADRLEPFFCDTGLTIKSRIWYYVCIYAGGNLIAGCDLSTKKWTLSDISYDGAALVENYDILVSIIERLRAAGWTFAPVPPIPPMRDARGLN